MSLLKSLTRQLFGVRTAQAGCPTDCYDVRYCVGDNWYKKRCCDRPDCTTSCGAGTYIGLCP